MGPSLTSPHRRTHVLLGQTRLTKPSRLATRAPLRSTKVEDGSTRAMPHACLRPLPRSSRFPVGPVSSPRPRPTHLALRPRLQTPPHRIASERRRQSHRLTQRNAPLAGTCRPPRSLQRTKRAACAPSAVKCAWRLCLRGTTLMTSPTTLLPAATNTKFAWRACAS